MLPYSKINPVKAKEQPWIFADVAIPMFFRWAYRMGAKKARLRVTAVGGAWMSRSHDSLEIGKKNQLAMRQILVGSGIFLAKEDIGGNYIRSLRLEIGTGRLMLSKSIRDREKLDSPKKSSGKRSNLHANS
jgi:chemotaxis protein CheD